MTENENFTTVHCEAMDVPADSYPVRLIWTDPPYGTGKSQQRGNQKYYDDVNTGYVLDALSEWIGMLASDGTMCVCCDYRLAPMMVNRMVEEGLTYRGEIIWTFGLGRPRTTWWPVRHNNILTFTFENGGLFDASAVPRTQRLAPKPGYSDDKPSGSVWEYTMNNTNPERVGYPNQKPVALIEPFVLAHTLPGDLVADPFMGSGSTGIAAVKHGRRFYGSDSNPEAVDIAKKRLTNV